MSRWTLALPADINGAFTLFSSFHHFDKDAAARLLEGAVRKGAGICVFEATSRNPATALLLFFLAPLAVLAMTPWVKPFRWSRLLWTYCVPAVPLMMGFDGMVSCLRTYTPEEMLGISSDLEAERIREAGRIPRALPASITYLAGLPSKQAQAQAGAV